MEVHGVPDKLPLSGTAIPDGRPAEGEQPPPKRAKLNSAPGSSRPPRPTRQTPYIPLRYSEAQVSLATLI